MLDCFSTIHCSLPYPYTFINISAKNAQRDAQLLHQMRNAPYRAQRIRTTTSWTHVKPHSPTQRHRLGVVFVFLQCFVVVRSLYHFVRSHTIRARSIFWLTADGSVCTRAGGLFREFESAADQLLCILRGVIAPFFWASFINELPVFVSVPMVKCVVEKAGRECIKR